MYHTVYEILGRYLAGRNVSHIAPHNNGYSDNRYIPKDTSDSAEMHFEMGVVTHRLDFSNSNNILTAEINTSGEVYVYHNSSKKLYAANQFSSFFVLSYSIFYFLLHSFFTSNSIIYTLVVF